MKLKHTFIHNLVLSAVLVFYPVILPADTSSAVPDTVQADGQKTQSSNLPDTRAMDEEAITVTQQNEAEAKEAQEAAPVESEDLYEGDEGRCPDP